MPDKSWVRKFMDPGTGGAENSPSSPGHSEAPGSPVLSVRAIRWLNGSVHWISGFVLLYAFISNGDTNDAMVNPVAMRGEVKLGLLVGGIFLVRLLWVHGRRSGGGRFVGPSARIPRSKVRKITDWAIYSGVAASVISGLLIAYLRPGAQLIPDGRGFTTSSLTLNMVVNAHAFVSDALEWLCGFHALYSLWYWKLKRTQWGQNAAVWAAGRLSFRRS